MKYVLLNMLIFNCISVQLFSQSGSLGNTVIHSGGEITVFGAHNFLTGSNGVLPGKIATKRDVQSFFSFVGSAAVIGASADAHVDGYVKNYNIPSFTFPIGDNDIYGPVFMNTVSINTPVNAAYYYADPSVAVTTSVFGDMEIPLPLGAPFDRNLKSPEITQISHKEYWDINGSESVYLTFYWQPISEINVLTGNNLSAIRLAGWNGTQWEIISASVQPGSTLTSGSITVDSKIIPDQYFAFTFAAANCLSKPMLTVGEMSCNGAYFTLQYITDASDIFSSLGSTFDGGIHNIPAGSDIKITARSAIGCETSVWVSLPAQCDDTCVLPMLSVGQPVCDESGSGFYKLAYAEPTAMPISISAGIRTQTQISQVPLGNDLIITAGSGGCQFTITVPAIYDCTNSCSGNALSVSAPFCASDQTVYSVNYTNRKLSAISVNAGVISTGRITGVPEDLPLQINVTTLSCQPVVTLINPPVCSNNAIVFASTWHDLNGDGLKQSAETPMSGITVNLYRGTGAYVASKLTDQNGEAVFKNLLRGAYYLEFNKPSDYFFSPPDKFPLDQNSDVNGANGPGTTSTFIIPQNNSAEIRAAGYYRCVPIGENVWYDINKNDIRNINENGINGLAVQLWRNESGIWTLYASTITGHKPGTPSDDGWWNFCAPPGQYYVKIIMPPLGLVQALPFVGGNPLTDSDLTNANGPGTTNSFVVTSGSSRMDLGGGYYPMAVAGNLVWRDDNLNGLQEPWEPKVSGVTVQAYDANTHQKLAESVTDNQGIYELDYLGKKDIYVKFVVPNGFAPTIPRAGADDVDSDVDHTYGPNTTRKISMWPGDRNENIDLGVAFGVLPVEWLDVNARRVNNTHLISWSTSREVNVSHYEVDRRLNNETEFRSLPGNVKANGNVINVSRYELIDGDVEISGTYIYRVKQVDFDGHFTYSKLVTVISNGQYHVDVYPNPARFESNIEVSLKDDALVEIDLLDAASKLVKKVQVESMQLSGTEFYKLNLENVPPGIYNLMITIDGVAVKKKLIRIE